MTRTPPTVTCVRYEKNGTPSPGSPRHIADKLRTGGDLIGASIGKQRRDASKTDLTGTKYSLVPVKDREIRRKTNGGSNGLAQVCRAKNAVTEESAGVRGSRPDYQHSIERL